MRHIKRNTVDAASITSDSELLLEFSRQYNTTRGWLGRFLSWKTCQGVDFIQVRQTNTQISSRTDTVAPQYFVVYDNLDRVQRLCDGLPVVSASGGTCEYRLATSTEIHCKMAAVQLVEGMRQPSAFSGTKTLRYVAEAPDRRTILGNRCRRGTSLWYACCARLVYAKGLDLAGTDQGPRPWPDPCPFDLCQSVWLTGRLYSGYLSDCYGCIDDDASTDAKQRLS